MFKVFTIIFVIVSISVLIVAISNAYRVRESINEIRNKNIYNFVWFNIGIAFLFVLYYIVFLSITLYETFHIGNLLASILFLLSSVFVYITSIVTHEMAKILYRLDNARKLDSLTNVYNRHYIEKTIKNEFQRCIRYKRRSCLSMIDINNFKTINDKYGHQSGDKVILDLIKTILAETRSSDVLGRYGGDEFIILMPETRLKEATAFAHRLCNVINTKVIESNGHKFKYDIAIGIAEVNYSQLDYEDWMRITDLNLYTDKKLKALAG